MKSGIQGLIYTFIATLAIYALVKNDLFLNKNLSMRFLKTIDDLRDDFCSRSSDELEEFYKSTSPNYEFDPKTDNELLQKIMKDFIINGSNPQELGVDELKEYFTKSPEYILILVLFIILCILFIPYFLCVCCKCCFCCPDSCTKCPNIMLIIALALCGLTLINCFVGYSKNSSIVDGVYGLGCSILKIEDHLINGDEYRAQKPYWVGIRGIIDRLEDMSKNITALDQKTKDIGEQLENDVGLLFKRFSDDLVNEYRTRKTSTVSNPDPESKDKPYIPSYLRIEGIYGPVDNKTSALGLIKTELDSYKYFSFNFTYTILYIIGNASQDKTFIDDNILTIKTDLENNINSVDTSIMDKISLYEETLDQIDSYSRSMMNTFFSINLIIVIIIGVSLILLLLCKHGSCILCISWSSMYIFMLMTFFLGAIFGLLGSFLQDASAGIKSLITNIDDIQQIDQQAKDIAKICLNGNGSLAESKNLINLDFESIIEKVFSLEDNIDEAIKNIDTYIPLSTSSNLKYYNNITKSKKNIKDIEPTLDGIKKFIDSSDSQSLVDSSDEIYDNWEISIKDCQEGYNYCRKQNVIMKNILQEKEKCCLLITEWELDEIKGRYEDVKAKDSSINITDNVEKYYNTIIDFLNTTNQLLAEIIDKNNEFNQTFHYIGLEEIKIVNKIKELFKPFREGFDEIVGNKSIFEILNCQFLKRDVNKIIEVLYESFGQTFKSTSSLLLMISGYELALTIVILIIMKSLGKNNSISSEDIEKK